VATFFAISADPSSLTISKMKGVNRASLHALPAGRQILEIHTFRARFTVKTASAVFGALLTGIPNLFVAHLVPASGTLRLTPKIRVQKFVVLALGAGPSILTFVTIFRATRTLSTNGLAINWGSIESIWTGGFTLRPSSEIQVIVALRGHLGTDAPIETTRAFLALTAQVFISNFIFTIRAMFNARTT